jgi:hypothetical protein
MRTMSIAGLLGLVGCGGSICEVLEDQLEATVDVSGEQPSFTWSWGEASAGAVRDLEGNELWQFQCDGTKANCVESGVTYGVAPDGTTEHTEMQPLESSVTYLFQIDRQEGGEGGCIVVETAIEEFVAP